jgi:spermidine synthase
MGIAIGNWLGGRLADRYDPKRILPTLYFVSAVLTFTILLLNTYSAGWDRPDGVGWPYWVALNVFVIFFLPACALGTISPVVAKLALDQGWSTGSTVGNVYAWGTAGSIIGTFLTGFVLIEAFGIRQIVATVAFILIAIGMTLAIWWRRSVVGMGVATILMAVLSVFAFADTSWAIEQGLNLNLRPDTSQLVYYDETNYFTIAIYDESSDVRVIVLDDLIHGYVNTKDPTIVEYDYVEIYAALTERLVEGKASFETLTIGGGGYVFPRYLELVYPEAHSDVIEIDPKVKEAAEAAFLLPPDDETTITSYIGDARNVISDLVDEGRTEVYDIVYLDAFNDFSVPFHLTTFEFNEQVDGLLAPDGFYVVNLIDIFDDDHGKFLGAFVTTAKETWENVYILGTGERSPTGFRETFIVVATDEQLDLADLGERPGFYEVAVALVASWEGSEMDFNMTNLMRHGRRIVLTDNWAPVDNLVSGLYTTP